MTQTQKGFIVIGIMCILSFTAGGYAYKQTLPKEKTIQKI